MDIAVCNVLAIKSKTTQKTWLPEVVEESGCAFIRLSHSDRGLARFASADLKSAHPLQGNSFLGCLRACRNKRAAEIFAQTQEGHKRPRRELIDLCDKIIDVEVPAFKSDGAGMKMKMLTSISENECVMVEATPQAVQFCRDGVQHAITADRELDANQNQGSKKARSRQVARYGSCPDVMSSAGNDNFLCVRYKDGDGRRLQLSRTVKNTEAGAEVMEQRIHHAARMLQEEYRDTLRKQSSGAPENVNS
jgi:hypothetical protein